MTYCFATIEQDDSNENPRDDWEMIGTLYTWHSKYRLGGKDDFNHQSPIPNIDIWCFDQFNDLANLPELEGYHTYDDEVFFKDKEPTIGELAFFIETIHCWINENLCILPVYMYDHSGITISTGPFSCPWDSGQVGIIYTKKAWCENQKIAFDQAEEILKNEIKILDQYLTGDVWSYTIYSSNDEEFEYLTNEIATHEDDLPDDRNQEKSCDGYFGYDATFNEVKELLTAYSTKT